MKVALLALAATGLFHSSAVEATPPIRVALTIDDLPAHGALPPGETRIDIARRIIAALEAAHLPPTYGFINAAEAERDPTLAEVFDLWREAGFPLGNHTWSHADLDTAGADAFVQEIIRDEPALASRMAGGDWHWMRFPFLHEGEDATARLDVRRALAARGYRIAAVTMSFGDYRWNEPYTRAVATGDKRAIRALERSYLRSADEALSGDHAAATERFGSDVPLVLLMHLGAFDARMMPRLLKLYHHRHVRFVSLDEAERDPAYDADVHPALPPAPKLEMPDTQGPDGNTTAS